MSSVTLGLGRCLTLCVRHPFVTVSSISKFMKSPNLSHRRPLSLSHQLFSYEGDGKTTVTILNHEMDSPLMVDSYHQSGFRLNNGMSVVGPIALFPRTVLSWDIQTASEITCSSLSLFLSLEPKIDILVLGVGDAKVPISSEALALLKSNGISVEILPTDHACTTFNFLNVEKRYVAAGLIPSRGSKPIEEIITQVRDRRAKEKLDY